MRSRLEEQFSKQHKKHISGYECEKFKYTIEHTYTPDFKITDNVFCETKGLWESDDRTKIKTVMQQNPGLEIIMIFQNPKSKIYPGSNTTYGMWCDRNNIKWFGFSDEIGIRACLLKVLREDPHTLQGPE